MLRHGSASRLWDAVGISPPWRQQQGQRPDRSQKVSQHISVLLSHLNLWRYQPRSDSNANGKRTCTRTIWSIMKYYEVTSAKTCHNLDILCRKVDAGTLSLWHRLTLSWFCIAKPQFEASEQTPYIHPWHIQFQRHLAAVLRLFQNMSNTSSIDLANHSLCTYTHSLRVPGCVCARNTIQLIFFNPSPVVKDTRPIDLIYHLGATHCADMCWPRHKFLWPTGTYAKSWLKDQGTLQGGCAKGLHIGCL